LDDGGLALRETLYACILDARRAEAVATLRAAAEAEGFPEVVSKILEPTLRLIGERWNEDGISLAQAYIAGKVAEDVLSLIAGDASELGSRAGSARGATVVCNAEDDYHALGRRMVATFLRIGGWEVIDLGNDVLASRLVDEAESAGARVVGVSAMMLTNAKKISKVREELSRRGLEGSIKLAVGGAVFVMRPELVAEVGADGTAATAMEAPALFDRLAASVRDA
jgi:methanogenic corrinoid protein MtbC1